MTSKKLMAAALCALLTAGVAACDQPKPADTKEKATSEEPEKKTDEQAKAGSTNQSAATAQTGPVLPFQATGPVATIDGKEVTAAQFNEEVERMAAMVPHIPPGQVATYKEKVLENVVSKRIVDDSIAAGNVKVSDEEVNAELDKFKKRLEEAGPGGLQMFLARANLTEDKLKEDIRESLNVKALLAKEHDVAVTDAQAKEHYEKNPAMFQRPERVKASHILLKLDEKADAAKVAEAEKKAKELSKEAKKKGADFAELAKQHSEGPTAPRGGDLGFFEKGRMVPEFEAVAYKLKPGQVSDPVRTQFGWHVIKVFEHEDAGKVPFDEVKEMIVAQLEQQKIREAFDAFLKQKKEAMKIEKMEQNIKDNPEYAQNQPPMQMPPGMMMGGQKPMQLQLSPGTKH